MPDGKSVTLTHFMPEKSYAQAGSGYFNPRDETFKLLGLKRAKEEYELARKALERNKLLFQEGHVSQKIYDDARELFSQKEVNYMQQMLSILFEKQYVIIGNAVKYSSGTGERHVRITLKNSSSGSAELKHLVNIDDELFRTLEPDIINNIYVSIKNNDNAIIGQPYEHKIERLLPNQPEELDFVLLQDLDVINVALMYGSNITDEKKIYLQRDHSMNRVELKSDQFSQEAELGKSATYDLSLELFSVSSDTFKLEVLNLPGQISRHFTAAGSSTRLSHFRFSESSSTQRASLRIFLPDRAVDSIVTGQSIKFYVLAVPQDRVHDLNLDYSRQYTEEELMRMEAGYVKLELVPRGIGNLLVRAQQLFFSAKAGGHVSVPIELVNDGTRSLNNVEIKVALPLNWTHSVDPPNINRLDVSEQKRVFINIMPVSDVAPGRYEARVTTTSLSDEQVISGDDRNIIIEIQAETNVAGMIIIILLILGLVGGMVVFGIKLSRR